MSNIFEEYKEKIDKIKEEAKGKEESGLVRQLRKYAEAKPYIFYDEAWNRPWAQETSSSSRNVIYTTDTRTVHNVQGYDSSSSAVEYLPYSHGSIRTQRDYNPLTGEYITYTISEHNGVQEIIDVSTERLPEVSPIDFSANADWR